MTARPLEARLWPKVDAAGPCWLWTGHRSAQGYGRIGTGEGRAVALVHRVVWELLVGPIPASLELDHLCRVRSCCNPDHLEPVTHAENVRRGAFGANRLPLAKCRRGHDFTPENTAVYARQRECITCRNARRERKSA